MLIRLCVLFAFLTLFTSFSQKVQQEVARKRLNKEQVFILKRAAIDLNFTIQDIRGKRGEFPPSELAESLKSSFVEVRKTEDKFLRAGAVDEFDRLFFTVLKQQHDSARIDVIEGRDPHPTERVINTLEETYRAYSLVAEARATSFRVSINSLPKDKAELLGTCTGHTNKWDQTNTVWHIPYGKWTITATLNGETKVEYFDASTRRKDKIDFDFTTNPNK